ncbi:MAG TPA: alkaline phosphatase family protein [Solirubrobacterales bacterium]|nr:alkaline phosphatase family protein [Solirubrobacterales bacterium]
MSRLRGSLNRAIAAAETLTGKRFGMLVASSVVATSAIVASAMTGAGDSGALAALLGRSLAAGSAPAAHSAAAESSPAPAAAPASTPAPAKRSSAVPRSAPLASPAPASPPSESAPSSEPPPAAPPLPEAGRIKHVFVISLTSPGYDTAFGETSQMPYLATQLRPKGELLSGYTLLGEAALPNGIATVSGQPPNASTQADCSTYTEFPPAAKVAANGVVSGTGCVYPVETLTISDQLASGQFRWRAYMEGMVDEAGKPANCVHPDPDAADAPPPGSYSAAQNPFVHFHSLLDLGDCATNDVPIEQLPADLRKAEGTANYSYIAPTPCDAGAAGQCTPGSLEGVAAADAFLAKWVPQILASPAYKEDGLLVVSFGAANTVAAETPPAPADDPLHVGALLVSRFLTPGATDATSLDPYSLLRTTEDLFGLSHLGLTDGAKVKSLAPTLLGEMGGD